MFSALWGIATQLAGHRLGQAAALVYSLDEGAITDIKPLDSSSDVTGTIQDVNGTTVESKWRLPASLQNSPPFYSELYQVPTTKGWYVLTFRTDSTLGTSEGWDHVTGLGTPSGRTWSRLSHAGGESWFGPRQRTDSRASERADIWRCKC